MSSLPALVLGVFLGATSLLGAPFAPADPPESASEPGVFKQQGGAADVRPAGARNFTHRKHVPLAWLSLDDEGEWDMPERQRDCRGCHNYGAGEITDPQAVCTQCHFSNADNDYTFTLWADPPGFIKDLTGLRTPDAYFQHAYHLILECRECHEVSKDEFQPPALIPGAGGDELCQSCHEGDKPRQEQLRFMARDRAGQTIGAATIEAAMARLKRELAVTLNDSLEMGPNTQNKRFVRPFSHADHVLPEFQDLMVSLQDLKGAGAEAAAGRRGNCATCHGPMFQAAAGLLAEKGKPAHVPFDQAVSNCGSCHIADAERTPIRFALEESERSSAVAGTFSHEQHLNFVRPGAELLRSSASGYAVIEAEGCAACHVRDRMRKEGFALKDALADPRSFQGCQSCHGTATWAPSEHRAWWTPEHHGEWQTCDGCHDSRNGDFSSKRPRIEVERNSPALFQIETQAHPQITVKDGSRLDGLCADCHRRPVELLPSRIQEASFLHSSHLPASPGPEDCAGCHSVMTVAQAELGQVYDPQACSKCHLGSPPVAKPAVEGAPEVSLRLVTAFSHADHAGKTLASGTAVVCTSCHEPSGAASVGTLPRALDCSLCHGHDSPERARITGGGVTSAEVSACSTCHVNGYPIAGRPSLIASSRVVDLVGDVAQHHPIGEQCSTCHLPRGGLLTSNIETPTGSRLFAERTFYVRTAGDPPQSAIHRGGTRKIGGDVSCFYCHWTGNLVASTGRGEATPDPETRVVREQQGDDLSVFPGGPKSTSGR